MKLKKLSFMNINQKDLLSRDKMREVFAGSGGGDCQHSPCAWPDFAACCCADGRKTCFENNDGGNLMCWGFCLYP